ncbi:hypothetical protein RFI_26848, partial [Reticulomyxa filosa]
VFVDLKEHKRISLVSEKKLIEGFCVTLHRLDAITFAFLCHTNNYVRYSCVDLVQSIQKAMQYLIAYYFTDKSAEEQQIQLSFPSSLGQLFELYSDKIIRRALAKFKHHQDNMKLTVLDFETNWMDQYYDNAEYHPKFGVLHALLDPNDFVPYSACMDAIVEQIQALCEEGSEYMRFLRIDCCQEILLQEKWLSVDEKSTEKFVLGSMCIALIPLIGFSDNGLDQMDFYDSVWIQLWRFLHENDLQLFNTVLYAIQCTHPGRVLHLNKSLHQW